MLLQESYSKIYEKANFAIVLATAVLLFVFSNIDFDFLKILFRDISTCNINIVTFIALANMLGIVLIMAALVMFVWFLKSRIVPVIDVNYINDYRFDDKSDSEVKFMIMEHYIDTINRLAELTAKKQKCLDRALSINILGIGMYLITYFIKGLI